MKEVKIEAHDVYGYSLRVNGEVLFPALRGSAVDTKLFLVQETDFIQYTIKAVPNINIEDLKNLAVNYLKIVRESERMKAMKEKDMKERKEKAAELTRELRELFPPDQD